ncbi:MAG: LPS assembly lipoprotein LptE [Alphaproteobacteria bacterium]
MQKFLNLIVCISLCACGFKPLYKKTSYNDLSEQTSEIAIAPVKNFDGARGIDLRNTLLNKLTPDGKPENPKYYLNITLSQPIITDYTIKNDGIASSYLITMNATYTLTNAKNHNVILTKTANSEISYNILKDQFSTEMLKNNAIKLAINDIAEKIYFSIIIYFTEKANGKI